MTSGQVSDAAPSKLEKLVDRFASNLRELIPGVAGHFACPLCRHLFSTADTSLLSIEHVIPESLGGRLEVVTCKACNSTLGTKIDAHLKRQIEMQVFLDGELKTPIRHRVVSPVGQATADVSIKPDEATLSVDVALIRELSNPQHFDEILNSILPLGFDMRLNPRPNARAARLALLKAAYLLMFYYFGYGYIASQPAKIVHEQLTKLTEEFIPLSIAIRPIVDPGLSHGVGIVIHPQNLSCFYVPLTLTEAGVSRHFGIVLPGYTEPDQVYSEWYKAASQMQEVNVQVRWFQPPPESLPSRGDRTLPIALWESTFKGIGS